MIMSGPLTPSFSSESIQYKSFSFFVFLYYLLSLGRGSSLFCDIAPNQNLVGFIIYLIFFIILLKNGSSFFSNRKFRYLILGVVLWCITHYFLDTSFYFMQYLMYLWDFITAYLLVCIYNKSFVLYYEKCMVLLAAISIPFWLFGVFIGFESLETLPFLLENTAHGGDGSSFILYTFTTTKYDNDIYNGIVRNYGCAWEPGLYSAMLNIAIFFNILKNEGRINLKDKGLLVLVIALVTTFSTTGYVAFVLLIGLHLLFHLNINIISKFFYLIIFSISSFYIYNLPFVSEKIAIASDESRFTSNTNSYEFNDKEERNYCAERFEGILLELQNIQDKPFFGYGAIREDSYISRTMSHRLVTSNSITKPISVLGLILCIPLFILLFLSTRIICLGYDYPVPWLLFVLIIVLSVSYGWFLFLFMHCFYEYALINDIDETWEI